MGWVTPLHPFLLPQHPTPTRHWGSGILPVPPPAAGKREGDPQQGRDPHPSQSPLLYLSQGNEGAGAPRQLPGSLDSSFLGRKAQRGVTGATEYPRQRHRKG